ncbi:Multidrug resistance-associated protein 7 [Amphibalanus amphitrite]|uniref:Multidrug resistance-associated protein 7 n=1 Tax=Amphibalanus amphitrite TaxID=1232801 RepID=A0A6A4WZH5_AMPAM|nr:Multidrug resistance-associated protein 7 [Amphibalanus amphitrite]
MQASSNATDLWLGFFVTSTTGANSTASPPSPEPQSLLWLRLQAGPVPAPAGSDHQRRFFEVYGGIAAGNAVLAIMRSFLFAYGGVRAARVVHDGLLQAVLKADLSFFSMNPVGRIVNRFSSDLFTVDSSLPFILNILLAQFAGLTGFVVVTVISLPWVGLLLLPLGVIYYYIQNFYRYTSRELKRLSTLTLSPVYVHFVETLSGLATVRALRGRDRGRFQISRTAGPMALKFGELVGVAYLYGQRRGRLDEYRVGDPDTQHGEDDDVGDDLDEGFEDVEDIFVTDAYDGLEMPHGNQPPPAPPAVDAASWSPADAQPDLEGRSSPGPGAVVAAAQSPAIPLTPDWAAEGLPEDVTGPDHQPGYAECHRLAQVLVGLDCSRGYVADEEAESIVHLWHQLSAGDRAKVAASQRYQHRLTTGRFKQPKTSRLSGVVPGVDSARRVSLKRGAVPAQRPDLNRLAETVVRLLCERYRNPRRSGGSVQSRWAQILAHHSSLRDILLKCPAITQRTGVNLAALNQHTLTSWFNEHQKETERRALLQGVQLPPARPIAAVALPAPAPRLMQVQVVRVDCRRPPHHFVLPADTVGQAQTRRRPAEDTGHDTAAKRPYTRRQPTNTCGQMILEMSHRLEASQQARFATQASVSWLNFRLQLIGVSMVTGVALLAVLKHHVGVETHAGLVGLAISCALSVTGFLSGLVSAFTETAEKEMVSMERIHHYSCTIGEGDGDRPGGEGSDQTDAAAPPPPPPPPGWPEHGRVAFVDVTLRYSGSLRPALSGVSFTVEPGQSLGVVGRTGSGKSSLLAALFRMHPTCGGAVFIDDVNVTDVSVETLRRSLSVIPQQPFLYSGTVRQNLDPSGLCSDILLWAALTECHLRPVIGSLDMELSEQGRQLSMGQRQLLCVARALLRQSQVVCLDEATANLDPETDRLIQATVQDSLRHKTVISIGHRLSAVRWCDRVLVMAGGEAVELGPPDQLLADSGSAFSALFRQQEKAECTGSD